MINVEYNNVKVIIMKLIYTVLQEERKRNEYRLERYQKRIITTT